MSEKHKHFVTIISPNSESVTVDIYLSTEEYELVNRISALLTSEGDITSPIMIVSRAVDTRERYVDGVIEED